MRTRNTVSGTETSAMQNQSHFSAKEDDDLDVEINPPQNIGTLRVQPRGFNSSSMNSIDNTHSPYFLHHPGLCISNQKLDGLNYNNWYIAMRMSLDAKNKIGFDGSLVRPAENDPLFKI